MNYEAEEKGVLNDGGGGGGVTLYFIAGILEISNQAYQPDRSAGWWGKAPEFGNLAEANGMETLFLVRTIHKS